MNDKQRREAIETLVDEQIKQVMRERNLDYRQAFQFVMSECKNDKYVQAYARS